MKRAAVLVACALAAAGTFAGTASEANPAAAQIVCVVNSSTNVTDAQISNALPAFQDAVDFDFAPVWNQAAQLVFVPAGQAPPAACWTITLMDSLDVFALGYHSTTAADVPFAHVEADAEWTITFTHELFEMLADPHADRYGGAYAGQTFPAAIYLLEVCDPVEADALAYTRPGADGSPVRISDFVTERWFDGRGRAKIDFTGHLRRAHTLYPGGYMWVQRNGNWSEQTA